MSQFPNSSKRKRPPVRGTYVDSDYSPWMKLNERDVASIAANTTTATPIFAIASAVESLALMTDPGSLLAGGGIATFSMSFFLTWILQTICFAILKTIACLLRNRGESLLRDWAAWLWKWFIAQAWHGFTSMFFGWIPLRRRLPINPVRPVEPDDRTVPRKRIIDRIFPLRRRK